MKCSLLASKTNGKKMRGTLAATFARREMREIR
jgi:hypothetical protein